MTHEERMSSFLDLLLQTHQLYAWTYDANMQLLHTHRNMQHLNCL